MVFCLSKSLSWANIRFPSHLLQVLAGMALTRINLQISLAQIQRELFYFIPPKPTPPIRLTLNNLFLYKEVTSSVCTSVAILATVIRLFVRRSVFWFDDLCALLSMLFVTTHMGIIVSTKPSSFATHYALISAMFYSTIWLARLSILFTIIRINPERRRPLFAVVGLFIVLPIILIGQVFWVCKPQQIICQPSQQIAIFKLVSDVIADLLLLTTSLHLFLVIQDKALRIRLSCLFSTCVLTTAVSFVNSSFILNSEGMKVIIIAVVEGSVSLIVANIPALSSVFISVGDHTSQRVSRGVATSIPHFVQHTDTQPSATDTIIKTPPDATNVMTQERHHDLESNPDNVKLKTSPDTNVMTQERHHDIESDGKHTYLV